MEDIFRSNGRYLQKNHKGRRGGESMSLIRRYYQGKKK